MKYLHLMVNDKFIAPYIEFIEKNFLIDEHFFYIIDGVDYVEIIKRNFIKSYIFKANNKILRKLYMIWAYIALYPKALRSEKIILHGLFNPLTIIFLFLNPWFLKKCNWIVWGGDLYEYENRSYNNYLKNIYYKMNNFVKKNVEYVNSLVPEDYEIAKKYYNIKGKYNLAIYPSKIDFEKLDTLILKKKKKDEIFIQIGNSADPSNNHIEVIEVLKKYKNEKIKIFCPLSYGSQEYANKIAKYGKNIFGDKFILLLDFMSYQEYLEHLVNVDILIFNHRRQQGLGNIMPLLYFEKKIYLREDISSWNYLFKDLNMNIYNVENIQKIDFKEFVKNNSKGNKENLIKTRYSTNYRKKIWENIFLNMEVKK